MRGKIIFLLLGLFFLTGSPLWAGYIGMRTMKLDGYIKDWTNSTGLHFLSDNTAGVKSNQYVWQDAANDDKGDGDYSYPTNAVFTPNSADIDQFRVSWDATNLYLAIRNGNGTSVYWASAFIIGIDTGTPDAGATVFIEGDGLHTNTGSAPELRSRIKCDYFLFVASTYKGYLWNAAGTKIGDGKDPDLNDGNLNNFFIKSSNYNEYEIAIPGSLLGNSLPTNSTWHFIVGSAFEENNKCREVEPDNSGVKMEWSPIGGDDTWSSNTGVDPDVFDLIGAPQAQQEADLNSYAKSGTPRDTNSFCMIQNSYVTVADYNKFLIQPSSINAGEGDTVPLSIRGFNTSSTGHFLNNGFTIMVFSNIGKVVGTNFYATNITMATARGFITFSMPGVSSFTVHVTLTSNVTVITVPPVVPTVEVPFSVDLSANYLSPQDDKLTITMGLNSPEHAECMIYSLSGVLVKKIKKDLTPSRNTIEWFRENDNHKRVGSGLYLIKVRIGSRVMIKKVLLVN